jgi:EAL domain-containing protein (putative c-di-GMP-specific phosphodiesterase class I)
VETREEAKIASENGFNYFQGNFFSKAEMVVMKDFKPVPARENWFTPTFAVIELIYSFTPVCGHRTVTVVPVFLEDKISRRPPVDPARSLML